MMSSSIKHASHGDIGVVIEVGNVNPDVTAKVGNKNVDCKSGPNKLGILNTTPFNLREN